MWHDIFDLQLSVGEKVLRALLIDVFLIVALRIVGKRSPSCPASSKVSPPRSSSRKACSRGLRRAGISLSELRAIARRQGFADLGEVDTAVLETNGVVSMFREDEPRTYHPVETPPIAGARRASTSP
jgi:uncharacterized membrane protein YcaP (DUF421 family)